MGYSYRLFLWLPGFFYSQFLKCGKPEFKVSRFLGPAASSDLLHLEGTLQGDIVELESSALLLFCTLCFLLAWFANLGMGGVMRELVNSDVPL